MYVTNNSMLFFCYSGLYDENLMHKKDLDSDLAEMIVLFLYRLQQPIGLVAHNGLRFDFGLVKTELQSIGGDMPGDLLCVDSLLLFRALHGESDLQEMEKMVTIPIEPQHSVELKMPQSDIKNADIAKTDGTAAMETSPLAMKVMKEETCDLHVVTPGSKTSSEIDPTNSPTQFATKRPYCKDGNVQYHVIMGAKYPRGSPTKKGNISYSLPNLHRRILGVYPEASHRAEDDALALVRLFQKAGRAAIQWADQFAVPYAAIPPLYQSKPRKPLERGVFPDQM